MCWQIWKCNTAIEHTAVKNPKANKSFFGVYWKMGNAIIYSNILISIMEGTIQCAALTDLFASLMCLPNDDDFSCKIFQIIAGTKKTVTLY